MPAGKPLVLRLTIADPFPGLRYSLQDADGRPVDAVTAGEGPLSLDAPVRYDQGRWLGGFVRREGPHRRFVYIALGHAAGDFHSPIQRRAKIDIHDIPADLAEGAAPGGILEVTLPGRGRDGTPACATVRPLSAWRAALSY